MQISKNIIRTRERNNLKRHHTGFVDPLTFSLTLFLLMTSFEHLRTFDANENKRKKTHGDEGAKGSVHCALANDPH